MAHLPDSATWASGETTASCDESWNGALSGWLSGWEVKSRGALAEPQQLLHWRITGQPCQNWKFLHQPPPPATAPSYDAYIINQPQHWRCPGGCCRRFTGWSPSSRGFEQTLVDCWWVCPLSIWALRPPPPFIMSWNHPCHISCNMCSYLLYIYIKIILFNNGKIYN